MVYSGKDHTFVLCAYKENKHLEECLHSLCRQSMGGNTLVVTATPNAYINGVCERHKVPLLVNQNHKSLGGDWNFGYEAAATPLVTIAHQDDIYRFKFREEVVAAANRKGDALIIHTGYNELKQGRLEKRNLLLLVKRLMNLPFRLPFSAGSKIVRNCILAFGCPICCPSVTFIKENVGKNVFDEEFKNSCDYRTWVKLAEQKGSFVYIPKCLMIHRIYAGSETTKNLQENIRKKEDLEILKTMWPGFVAKLINKVYALSEKSNKV